MGRIEIVDIHGDALKAFMADYLEKIALDDRFKDYSPDEVMYLVLEGMRDQFQKYAQFPHVYAKGHIADTRHAARMAANEPE